MPLTDQDATDATLKDRPYKLTDEKGLCFLVTRAGKYWRFNYRFHGKQKTISLGVYPDVTLTQAREQRNEARKLLALGVNPSEQRKERKEHKKEQGENPRHKSTPLRFDLSEQGALLIETDTVKLRLTLAQTTALRAFLDATKAEPVEGNPPC